MRLSSKTCLFFVAVFACPLNSFATEFTLLDQLGNPVANAVISIDNASLKNPPLEVSTLPVAIMDQVDYQFSPKVLLVRAGQAVDFPNSDDVRHHVYSFSAPKNFEIKMYQGSDAAPVQFEKSGLVVLGCNIHDSMVGYIYVSKNETSYLSDEEGKVTIPKHLFKQLNKDVKQDIHIWHPQLSIVGIKRLAHSIDLQRAQQTIHLDMLVETTKDSSLHDAMPANTFQNKFKRGM